MGTAQYLTVTGPGEITDGKMFGTDQPGAFSNDSPPLEEFDQAIAIDIPLGCGGYLAGPNGENGRYVIGNFHFQFIKKNDTQWQLHLVGP